MGMQAAESGNDHVMIDTYREATAAQARAEAEVKATTDRRAYAVAQLHADGWSLGRIAGVLGVTRARVQQLVKRGRTVTPGQ
jgi:DNA-directed RNA polymerase specialized sigma24 family protein